MKKTPEFNWIKPLEDEPLQFEFFKIAISDLKIKLIFSDIKYRVFGTPVMLELGAGEGQYSKYFDATVPFCHNICVEIQPKNCKKIKKLLPNAKIYNGFVGDRVHSGEKNHKSSVNTKFNLLDIYKENQIRCVDILHMDIQGSEVSILEELAENNLLETVKYFFISTHNYRYGEEVFNTCDVCVEIIERELRKKGIPFEYLYCSPEPMDINGDGLIVLRIDS